MITYFPPDKMDSTTLSLQYSKQKQRVERVESKGPGTSAKTASGIVLRSDPFSKISVTRKSSEVKVDKLGDSVPTSNKTIEVKKTASASSVPKNTVAPVPIQPVPIQPKESSFRPIQPAPSQPISGDTTVDIKNITITSTLTDDVIDLT